MTFPSLLWFDFAGGVDVDPIPSRPLLAGSGGGDAEITAHLLDLDLAPVGDDDGLLALTRNWKWRDELSETGNGGLDMMLDDPAQGSLARDGDDVVQFRIDDVPAFSIFVEDYEQDTISPDEESGEVTTFSGEGTLSILNRSVVYPVMGTGRVPIQEDRVFNWTAFDYDDTDWDDATAVTDVFNAQTNWPVPWAPDFPVGGDGITVIGGVVDWDGDPITANPDIIWTDDGTITDSDNTGTTRYSRQLVTFPSDDSYLFFIAMDNMGELFIDGNIVTGVESSNGFTKTTIKQVDVSAGEHVIAWSCTNVPQVADNPAGAAWEIFVPSYAPVILIAQSQASEAKIIQSEQPPGMSPGRVMRLVLDEAHDRGELLQVTLGFDDVVDSGGNPWADDTDPVVLPTISTKVGNDLLTFFREIAGTYTDMWMPPDSWVLRAWRYGEMLSDLSGTAVLAGVADPDDPDSGNLTLLRHKGQFKRVQRLLVRWLGGWAQVDLDGLPENVSTALLGLGAVDNRGEVQRIGNGQLAIFANPREAITVGVAPVGADDTPYVGYQVGDLVEVPISDGSPSIERVMALTVSIDNDTGRIVWNPQIIDVILVAEQEFAQSIKKMTNGTLGGRSKVAQPVVPLFVPRPRLPGDGDGGIST